MNPVGIGPNSEKMVAALSKLKWLVVVENYEIETATFWKAPQAVRRRRRPSQIQTEVYQLPAASFAEKDGTLHQLGALAAVEMEGARSAGPGQDRPGDHRADLPRRARPLQEGGRRAAGAGAQRRLELHQPRQSRPRRGAEGDQRQGARRPRRAAQGSKTKDRRSSRPPGQQLDGFGQLRDDGSTMCGNWLHSGVYTEAGNNAQRREQRRPDAAWGCSTNWALLLAGQPPHHVQPRLGRRAGQALGSEARRASSWNGEKWVGDVPDIKPDSPPGTFGAFIMLPEGVGRLFAPVAQRRARSPSTTRRSRPRSTNALHPKVSVEPGR